MITCSLEVPLETFHLQLLLGGYATPKRSQKITFHSPHKNTKNGFLKITPLKKTRKTADIFSQPMSSKPRWFRVHVCHFKHGIMVSTPVAVTLLV